MLFLEGGYFKTRKGPKFWRCKPPSDEDIHALVASIAKRVIRFLKQKGYFQDDVDSAVPEEDMAQESLLPELQAARPAVAEERLELQPSGDVILRLKTPYTDGTTHLLFSGIEFVEKLAALIPPAIDTIARMAIVLSITITTFENRR